jgi:hypothetical protein
MEVWCRVLFLASEYVSKQVRVVPSINTPTKVNPSVFCNLKKEPWSDVDKHQCYQHISCKNLELSNIFVIHCIKANVYRRYWGSYLSLVKKTQGILGVNSLKKTNILDAIATTLNIHLFQKNKNCSITSWWHFIFIFVESFLKPENLVQVPIFLYLIISLFEYTHSHHNRASKLSLHPIARVHWW